MTDPTTDALSQACVHAGEDQPTWHHTIATPVAHSATYTFENTAALIAYMQGRTQREEYGRYGNPTVDVLEKKVSALEGTEDCAAFGSGMAAMTTAILALAQPQTHVVLYADCYRRTRQFVSQVLPRFGIEHSLVASGDIEGLRSALRKNTRLVVCEAPTNPYLNVIDIPALVGVCKEQRVKTLIDATFATPINMRPADLGVDLVVHSATKYLAGHNDVLAGVVAGKSGLISLIRELRDVMGGICDPHAAYLVLRGIKTLALRVVAQNASALNIATMLEAHPSIERVWYPGLSSHPSHETARKLMRGFGGVVSFEVKGDLERTSAFIDRLRIPKIAPSLGGVESLVEQPALMSFFELSTEEREAVGIRNNLVRLSVGIEDNAALIADLAQALNAESPRLAT